MDEFKKHQYYWMSSSAGLHNKSWDCNMIISLKPGFSSIGWKNNRTNILMSACTAGQNEYCEADISQNTKQVFRIFILYICQLLSCSISFHLDSWFLPLGLYKTNIDSAFLWVSDKPKGGKHLARLRSHFMSKSVAGSKKETETAELHIQSQLQVEWDQRRYLMWSIHTAVILF